MKEIYLVRHCRAEGQNPDAPLTEEGYRQSFMLANFFKDRNIEYIVSCPFLRAIDSIKPLSETINKEIHIDVRLQERVLSTAALENWMELLKRTFDEYDLRFEGGETSSEATSRGLELFQELATNQAKTIVVVTHGALLSLMIKHFDKGFGFDAWKNLSNPDVYRLTIHGQQTIVERVWEGREA